MSAHRVRRIEATDAAGLDAYIRIRTTVAPENPDSLDQVRWEDATYPGQVTRLLIEEDGRPVATGTTGRVWMNRPDYPRYWLGLWVLPGSRRRGFGSVLYRAVSDIARDAGKTGFQTELSEVHDDGVRFLVNRGFRVSGRAKMVRLQLEGMTAPTVSAPPGISLTTLADRPDLIRGVHATAVEALPDIPTSDEPIEAGSLEAFVARDVDRVGVPRDSFAVAIDEPSGMVVGYASLIFAPGSTVLAYHDMTAVRPAWRGRGIATALKQATIAWAIEHRLEALETGNDVENSPMRAINLALGYRPIPDSLELLGPLASEAPQA